MGFFSRIKRTARAMRDAWSSKLYTDEKIPTYEETSSSSFPDEKNPQGNNLRESTAVEVEVVAPPAYAQRSTPAPQKSTVALHHAAFTGNVLLTSAHLCTPGINVNTTDKHGYTPLLYAAQKGRTGVVKRLLKTSDIEVNPCDSFGISALSWAARRGHLEVVELLCKTQGVVVDHKCNKGRTPLLRAAMKGHVEVVDALIKTGQVEIDVKDNIGSTPLMLASQGGHEAVVELLLKVSGESGENTGLR